MARTRLAAIALDLTRPMEEFKVVASKDCSNKHRKSTIQVPRVLFLIQKAVDPNTQKTAVFTYFVRVFVREFTSLVRKFTAFVRVYGCVRVGYVRSL